MSYKGTEFQEHGSESGTNNTEFYDCVHKGLPMIPSARKLGLAFEDDMPKKQSLLR